MDHLASGASSGVKRAVVLCPSDDQRIKLPRVEEAQNTRPLEFDSKGFFFEVELRRPVIEDKADSVAKALLSKGRQLDRILYAYGIMVSPSCKERFSKKCAADVDMAVKRIFSQSGAGQDGRVRLGDLLVAIRGRDMKDLAQCSQGMNDVLAEEDRNVKTKLRFYRSLKDVENMDDTAGRRLPLLHSVFGEKLLNDPSFADVVFVVKGEEIQSYKVLITAGSPVFAAMLTHDMVEKATSRICINDFDPPVFKTLLRFIYNNTLGTEDMSYAHLFEVARAGHMYQVDELEDRCLRRLEYYVSTSTALDMVLLAEKSGLRGTPFCQKILKFMALWSEELMSSRSWKSMNSSAALLNDFCRTLSKFNGTSTKFSAKLAKRMLGKQRSASRSLDPFGLKTRRDR